MRGRGPELLLQEGPVLVGLVAVGRVDPNEALVPVTLEGLVVQRDQGQPLLADPDRVVWVLHLLAWSKRFVRIVPSSIDRTLLFGEAQGHPWRDGLGDFSADFLEVPPLTAMKKFHRLRHGR